MNPLKALKSTIIEFIAVPPPPVVKTIIVHKESTMHPYPAEVPPDGAPCLVAIVGKTNYRWREAYAKKIDLPGCGETIVFVTREYGGTDVILTDVTCWFEMPVPFGAE